MVTLESGLNTKPAGFAKFNVGTTDATECFTMAKLPKITITVDSPIGIRTDTWYGKQVSQGRCWAAYWRSLGYQVELTEG